MTWEEIIIKIRTQPEYKELVEKSYVDENLILNIERFKSSEEYSETKKIITKFFGHEEKKKILDIGSGNGISAVSFALDGNAVTAVEPDKSVTVGNVAIQKLISHFSLSNLYVIDSFGEKLPLDDNSFDLVYIRQAMHHANDLKKFICEASRVLKKGGLLLTIRDHVIYDENDKKWFLDSHPLHKFYKGENAFTFDAYKSAIQSAGLEIKKVLKHFDSVINYYPMNEKDLEKLIANRKKMIDESLGRNLPSFIAKNSIVKKLYSAYIENKLGPPLNEKIIPGRMYSFIAVKQI